MSYSPTFYFRLKVLFSSTTLCNVTDKERGLFIKQSCFFQNKMSTHSTWYDWKHIRDFYCPINKAGKMAFKKHCSTAILTWDQFLDEFTLRFFPSIFVPWWNVFQERCWKNVSLFRYLKNSKSALLASPSSWRSPSVSSCCVFCFFFVVVDKSILPLPFFHLTKHVRPFQGKKGENMHFWVFEEEKK